MHRQRLSTALRQLDDLASPPGPPRWWWAIATLEPSGRIVLPAAARAVLGQVPGHRVQVWGRGNRLALTLLLTGPGAATSVDGRGRVYLPVWLRRCASVLIGACADPPLIVVADVDVLDGIGELLAKRPK